MICHWGLRGARPISSPVGGAKLRKLAFSLQILCGLCSCWLQVCNFLTRTYDPNLTLYIRALHCAPGSSKSSVALSGSGKLHVLSRTRCCIQRFNMWVFLQLFILHTFAKLFGSDYYFHGVDINSPLTRVF